MRLLYPFFVPKTHFPPKYFTPSLSPSPLLKPTVNPPSSTTHEPATPLCCHVARTKSISTKISPHRPPVLSPTVRSPPTKWPRSTVDHCLRPSPSLPTEQIRRAQPSKKVRFSLFICFSIFSLLWYYRSRFSICFWI